MKPIPRPGRGIAAIAHGWTDSWGGDLGAMAEGPSRCSTNRLALSRPVGRGDAVAAGACPMREPPPGGLHALEAIDRRPGISREIWPAVYVRFEGGLLQGLGFGPGTSPDAPPLARWTRPGIVSPQHGGPSAARRDAGGALSDKMLPLHAVHAVAQGRPGRRRRQGGEDITGTSSSS